MSVEKSPKITLRKIGGFLVDEIGKLKFNRTPTAFASDPEYKEHIPEIAKLYEQTEYWHGTGRYKYSQSGELTDILQGIIEDGGLITHDDEWDKKRGKIQTISVAPSRMYARLYAGMYSPAGTRISNELGSRELWGYYFFGHKRH